MAVVKPRARFANMQMSSAHLHINRARMIKPRARSSARAETLERALARVKSVRTRFISARSRVSARALERVLARVPEVGQNAFH